MSQETLEQYNYCDFNQADIKSILEKVFFIEDFSEIENAYQKLTCKFYDESKTIEDPLATKANLKPATTDNEFLNQFLNEKYIVGIDLPTMIGSKENSNGKCVFIVGEDPLRNSEHFIQITKESKISISTPFALHLSDSRKGVYWKFSAFLLQLGYNIYYTDAKKIWIKKNGCTAKMALPSDVSSCFTKCLATEIATFKPSLIITFGNPAKEFVRQLNNQTPTLSFIHPSYTAKSHWKKKLQDLNNTADIKATNENILVYMKNEFNHFEEKVNKLI